MPQYSYTVNFKVQPKQKQPFRKKPVPNYLQKNRKTHKMQKNTSKGTLFFL